jgi:hypothetical protein
MKTLVLFLFALFLAGCAATPTSRPATVAEVNNPNLYCMYGKLVSYESGRQVPVLDKNGNQYGCELARRQQ